MRSIVRFYEQEVPVLRGAIRDIPDYAKGGPIGLGASLKDTVSGAAQNIKGALVQGAKTANNTLKSASTALNQTGVGQAVRAVGNITADDVKDTYDNVKNIASNTGNLTTNLVHAGPDAVTGFSKLDSLKNIANSSGELFVNKLLPVSNAVMKVVNTTNQINPFNPNRFVPGA
jgi:hypothetical protein